MNIRNKINGLRKIWRFDNRWELIRDRLLSPKKQIQIYRLKELVILEDHAAGDANGAREIITSEMYRRFLPLIDASKPLSVLDIGANNGGFPLLLKLEGIPIKKLVAVEFNPATFGRLTTNIEKNFTEMFILFNVALCGTNRTVAAPIDSAGTADSIYSGDAQGFEVEGLTFNSIFEKAFGDEIVDVCKIDVEGAEFEVFPSGDCSSIVNCRNLIIEIHHSSASPRRQVIGALDELGFDEVNGDNKRADNLHYVHFFRNRQS